MLALFHGFFVCLLCVVSGLCCPKADPPNDPESGCIEGVSARNTGQLMDDLNACMHKQCQILICLR
ncbi:hypothetical protein LHK_00858 [Laribacter hongkongensis HLHK9]|uniref:Uncharacterized protein n=1 Tax=Laribacter hongkongensis (strain HLHK9) TaxID=557598 RepID=C1D534_LARHH|nr:hypothetical protein LHK_00858 [Laribacter hongkongensis HLHK9]